MYSDSDCKTLADEFGLKVSTVFELRDSFASSVNLAELLRSLIERDGLNDNEARMLLRAAFRVSAREFQFYGLWQQNLIDDVYFDACLREAAGTG